MFSLLKILLRMCWDAFGFWLKARVNWVLSIFKMGWCAVHCLVEAICETVDEMKAHGRCLTGSQLSSWTHRWCNVRTVRQYEYAVWLFVKVCSYTKQTWTSKDIQRPWIMFMELLVRQQFVVTLWIIHWPGKFTNDPEVSFEDAKA